MNTQNNENMFDLFDSNSIPSTEYRRTCQLYCCTLSCSPHKRPAKMFIYCDLRVYVVGTHIGLEITQTLTCGNFNMLSYVTVNALNILSRINNLSIIFALVTIISYK